MYRRLAVAALMIPLLALGGCLGLAAAGAIGVAGAAVGTTAKVGGKVVGATASAIIPGESKKQRAKRLEREERDRERAAKDAEKARKKAEREARS